MVVEDKSGWSRGAAVSASSQAPCGSVLASSLLMETDQHVHGQLQFVVGAPPYHLSQVRDVRQVGFADQHAVPGIAVDHARSAG